MVDADYLATTLKTSNPVAYATTLFAPETVRPHMQALWAFATDIAEIRDRVSEPTPGEIRLQWWLDLLEGTEHGSAMANPVAAGLLETIDKFDLATGPLRRLISAHRFDLYDDPMPDISTFEGYAGETRSIVYQFCTMVLNGGNDPNTADAAGHFGVATRLIDVMMALPITASRAQIIVPWEVYARHGVEQNQFFARASDPSLIDAQHDLLNLAREHLDKSLTAINDLPVIVRPAFASFPVYAKQLNELDKFANLPFAPPRPAPQFANIARMTLWMVRNGR